MTLAADGPPGLATPPSTRAVNHSPPFDEGNAAGFVVLAEAIGDGLVQVDDMGAARALNDTALALLTLIGGADGGLAPVELFDALTESREQGRAVLREYVAQAPGSKHIRIAALVSEGSRLIALRDSTDERLLQERLLQSEKMASVGQLVSGVAHELNNPLTGVMGFAQLLLARDLDEITAAQVQTIYGEAERAAKIVQNLLSFARRRRPTKEMADVNALLAQVLELRSYDFAIRNISLDMTLDTRMPRCWVDADQVQQVFFNVIKNAEQAMIEANGGGRLTVGRRPWAGRARRNEARTRLPARAPALLGPDHDRGRRPRHPAGGPAPHLRPVLHHEGGGPGHRPRPDDLLRHHRRARRPHLDGGRRRTAAPSSRSSCRWASAEGQRANGDVPAMSDADKTASAAQRPAGDKPAYASSSSTTRRASACCCTTSWRWTSTVSHGKQRHRRLGQAGRRRLRRDHHGHEDAGHGRRDLLPGGAPARRRARRAASSSSPATR